MLVRAATAPQKGGERAQFVLLGEGEDVCLPFLHPSQIKTTATSDVALLHREDYLFYVKRCICVK